MHEQLLSNPEAVREIERYKWIESEKAGRDIGFDTAAKEWLVQYAEEWLKFNPLKFRRSGRSVKSFI